MKKMQELRMSLIILVIGLFLLTGCIFSNKVTVNFKTNGGTEMESIVLTEGSTLDDIKTPTKDGYEFVGWYLDGEEYDFDDEVVEDITLVAKWKKITVLDKLETTTTETTTTKSETTTTKKTTTTTLKQSTTTTTIKVVVPTTTVVQLNANNNEQPNIPVVNNNNENNNNNTPTPLGPVVNNNNTVSDLLMVVTKTFNDETSEYKYVIGTDGTSENTNVISMLSDEDYKTFVESDLKNYTIENNLGVIYDLTTTTELDHNTSEISAFYIHNDNLQLTLVFNILDSKWYLDYANVKVTGTLTTHYYDTLSIAISLATDGDVIDLLDDIESSTLVLTKQVEIKGNDKKITLLKNEEETETKYLFEIDYTDDTVVDSTISIRNLTVDTSKDSFLLIKDDSKLTKLNLSNITGVYSNHLITIGNNVDENIVIKENVTISTPL